MKGRIWLVIGVVVGIAIGIGRLAYFAGAAMTLSDTALRVVGTAAQTIIGSTARRGAPRRVVEGLAALVALVVPGVTALLLIVIGRTTIVLRALLGLLVLALGAASFFYLPNGPATGVLLLSLVVAGIAVVATGPLIAAPLAALAALIGTLYLPRLASSKSHLPHAPLVMLHEALFASGGVPLWLRVLAIVLAAIPFAVAGRLVLR